MTALLSAEISSIREQEFSTLIDGCRNGNAKWVLSYLKNFRKNHGSLGVIDEKGNTSLIYACIHGCNPEFIEIIKKLLSNKGYVLPYHRNKEGLTALNYAQQLNIPEIINLFLTLPKSIESSFSVYRYADFEILYTITTNNSNYGILVKARYIPTGETCVLKKYKRDTLMIAPDNLKEMALLYQTTHYNSSICAKLYGISFVENQFFLILEPMDVTLQQLLSSSVRSFRKSIFRQIFEKLSQLHSLGICHCDLSFGNVMYREDTGIKFIDLGISDFLGISPRKDIVEYYIATDYIKAPDNSPFTLSGIEYHTSRKSYTTDVFSVGVLMANIFYNTRYDSYLSVNGMLYRCQINRKYNTTLYVPLSAGRLSPDLYDLLCKLLDVNSETRLASYRVLQHRYFTGINFHEEKKGEFFSTLPSTSLSVFTQNIIRYTVSDLLHSNYELYYRYPIYNIYSSKGVFGSGIDWILVEWIFKVHYCWCPSYDTLFNVIKFVNVLSLDLEKTSIDSEFLSQKFNLHQTGYLTAIIYHYDCLFSSSTLDMDQLNAISKKSDSELIEYSTELLTLYPENFANWIPFTTLVSVYVVALQQLNLPGDRIILFERQIYRNICRWLLHRTPEVPITHLIEASIYWSDPTTYLLLQNINGKSPTTNLDIFDNLRPFLNTALPSTPYLSQFLDG